MSEKEMPNRYTVLVFGLCLILSLYSCNVELETSNKQTFEVICVLRASEDDIFQLFYVTGRNKDFNFNNQQRIAVPISGNETPQIIRFRLPPGDKPCRLRLDVGENKLETEVHLKKVSLIYGDTLVINDSEIHRFFYANQYLEKDGLRLTRKSFENRYDPFIISTPLLEKKMQLKLYQAKCPKD